MTDPKATPRTARQIADLLRQAAAEAARRNEHTGVSDGSYAGDLVDKLCQSVDALAAELFAYQIRGVDLAAAYLTPCPVPADGAPVECLHGRWPCGMTLAGWALRGFTEEDARHAAELSRTSIDLVYLADDAGRPGEWTP